MLPPNKTVLPGIYRDKTVADKLIYIPNYDTQNTPSVDYNKWLKRLDTTNQNSIKVPKVVKLTYKKTLI